MSDGPPAEGGEVPTSTGAKPSIAEVAAWLRRAAEQRDTVEELRPLARPVPQAPAVDEEATERDERGPGTEAATDGGPPPETVPEPSLDGPSADEPGPPDDHPVALAADRRDQPVPVAAGGDVPTAEADAGAEPPTDQAEAAADPRPDDPEPDEAAAPAGPSASTEGVEGVERVQDVAAPDEHHAVGSDGGPQASQAALSAAAPDSERADVDLDLRDRSETRPAAGPVDDQDLPVPGPARRPFGSGRSPRDLPGPVSPPSASLEAHDDLAPEAPAGEPVTSLANGAGGQTAAPATDAVVARADQPDIEAEADEKTAVPAVEALVEDDLPPAPPAAVRAEADVQPEPEPVGRGNGHERPSTGRTEPARAAAGGSTVSLFDLDLADLAARARAAGERGEPAPRPDLDPPTRATAPRSATGSIEVDDPEPEPAVSEVRDRHEAQVVDQPAPVSHGLTWDDEDDRGVLTDDEEADEEPQVADAPVVAAPPAAPFKAKAATAAATAIKRRRTKRKRYPRGQLKERIGVLRRVRAMLGVVVLTVVLGVAAGAAIGAFIVFVAFAVRSAITSG